MSPSKRTTALAQALAAKRLMLFEQSFHSSHAYNRELFQLYLKYCRARKVTYDTCKQAEKLKSYLEKTPIEVLKNWTDILDLDAKNPLELTANQLRHQGKPFRKIGLMLEELGVLKKPLSNHEMGWRKILDRQKPLNKSTLEQYLHDIALKGRSHASLYILAHYLNHFMTWLDDTRQKNSILLTTSADFNAFTPTLVSQFKPSTIYDLLTRLSHFFSWSVDKGWIVSSPIPSTLKVARPKVRHRIVSSSQVAQLMDEIKSPHADPDEAMLLVMILLFAFRIEDCREAKLYWTKETVEIYWPSPKKSFKQRKPRPRLKLPDEPPWFRKLLASYLTEWKKRRVGLLDQSEHLPFFIGKNTGSKGVGKTWIASRIAQATFRAVGHEIPCHILRQTAAKMHLRGEDSSILTRLGWAGNSAITYTYIPVTYYVDPKQDGVEHSE